jgi:hypothetical protein
MSGIKGMKMSGRLILCPHGVLGKRKCRICRLEWEREWIKKGNNREKGRKATARWQEKHREHTRAYARIRAGIPAFGGESRFGLCPICRKERTLVPDHNHNTGSVRDWICGPCNRALGFYEKWKKQFAKYLRRFQ